VIVAARQAIALLASANAAVAVPTWLAPFDPLRPENASVFAP
jgi:hypothetical protein